MADRSAIIAALKAQRAAGRRTTSDTGAPAASSSTAAGISPLLQQYQQWTTDRNYGSFLPRPADEYLTGGFGPLTPIEPMGIDQPEDSGRPDPRRYQYQVGWNMPIGQPGTEGLKLANFQTLQSLADLYSVARSCIRLRKQELRGLEWDIIPTKEAEKRMRGDSKAHEEFHERRSEAIKFFKNPDPEYGTFSSWIDALLEEVLVYDALSLHLLPYWGRGKGLGLLGSDLKALELLNGATIRPLVDLHGSRPRPPYPAYQQYLYGVPRADLVEMITERDLDDNPDLSRGKVRQYRGDQLIYAPYTKRTWTPYGFPPIEQALVPVITGLRKQGYQLDYFDEGTVPAAYISPGDPTMTPQQIRELQDALNAIAGDTAWKHKIIVLPPGSKVDPQKSTELADKFDDLVMTQVCMAFDVMPTELGLHPGNSSGHSTGGGLNSSGMAKKSDDVNDRRARKPLLLWLKETIFDRILQQYAAQHDMQWMWEGLEEDEDKETKTNLITQQIGSALLSIDEGRIELGKTPWGLPQTSDPGFVTASGFTPLGEFDPVTGHPGAEPGDPDYVPPGVDPKTVAAAAAQAATAAATNPPPQNGQQPQQQQQNSPSSKTPAAGQAGATPGHQAGDQAKPGKQPGGGVQVADVREPPDPVHKGQLAELDALRRHLNKGRDVETWEPRHLDEYVLGMVKDLVNSDVVSPDDAVKAVQAVLTKDWSGVVFDPSKHPRGSGAQGGQFVASGSSSVNTATDHSLAKPTAAQAAARQADVMASYGLGAGGAGGSISLRYHKAPSHPNKKPKAAKKKPKAKKKPATKKPKKKTGNAITHTGMKKKPVKAPRRPKKVNQQAIQRRQAQLAAQARLNAVRYGRQQHVTPGAPTPTTAIYNPGAKKAAESDPKASAPPQTGATAEQWAAWSVDLALVSLYAKQLANSMTGAVSKLGSRLKRWLSGGEHDAPAAVGELEQELINSLEPVLKDLWANAWVAGEHSAEAIVRAAPVDWGTWVPGDPAAAHLVRDRVSFENLLNRYGVRDYRGIAERYLDEAVRLLHDALLHGDSPGALAGRLMNLVASPERALLIAQTEIARAISAATEARYREAGVEFVEWATAEDERVCPICGGNELAGVIPIGTPFPGGTPTPPAHPRCRCALLAVITIPTPDGEMPIPDAKAFLSKCLTCGCDMPHNEHDDRRHLTIEDLEAAAVAAGITVDQAYEHLIDTPSLNKVGPHGYSHGWVKVGEPGAQLAKTDLKLADDNLSHEKSYEKTIRDVASRWSVSDDDARALAGAEKLDATGLTGQALREHVAGAVIHDWRGSSGKPAAVAAITHVADQQGRPYVLFDNEHRTNQFIRGREGLDRATRSLGEAMHGLTQDWFKQRGITHVEVHRSTSHGSAWDDGRPFTSWTVDSSEVRRHGEQDTIRHETVPVDRVFSLPNTGLGTFAEAEAVLLPPKVTKGFVSKSDKVKAAGLAVRAKDTGRILMLQRYLDDGDPAGGTWEFPGGRLDDGEHPIDAAEREWQEETGCELPAGDITGRWVSKDGVYHGFVMEVAHETDVPIHHGREPGSNPDDPDGDEVESLAWWEPKQIRHSSVLRDELVNDWKRVKRALKGDVVKMASGDAEKTTDPAYQQMLQDYPADAISWMKNLSWRYAEVPQNRIDYDSVERWQAHHEPGKVDHFKDKVLAGHHVHPVVMVREPRNKRLIVIDGHHRTLAYQKLNQPVPAYVADVPSRHGPWFETHSSQYVDDGVHPTRVEKVGPKGYVHGWIKVGAVDGIKDVTYSSKTGKIRHRGTKTVIGRIGKDQENGGWFHAHENGHTQAGHKSAQAAAKALVEHHNEALAGHYSVEHAPTPKVEATLLPHDASAPKTPKTKPKPPQHTNQQLDADQQRVVDNYVIGGYLPINGQLRTGKLHQSASGDVSEMIRHLDAAMENSTTKQPINVFRGITHLPEGMTKGGVINEPGFSSTSLTREIGEGFSKNTILMQVNVPAGSHGVQVSGTEGREDEFIIDRGAHYRVNRIMRRKDGSAIVDVTLESTKSSRLKDIAPFTVFPEGKISATDDRSRYVTLGADRANERAAMFWSSRFQHVKAIKKAARGEEFSMNVSPSRDYSVDGYPEIYGEKEYSQDVKHAAEWLTKSVNEAPATSAPLYRGMAINDPEVEKALTTVGSEFPSDLASWSRKPEMAKIFADMHHDNKAYAGPSTKIVMELEPGAHALDIEPHVHGPLKDQAEHVATGRYQVVSKDVKDDVVHVKVREVSRDPAGTKDQGNHGPVPAAGGEGPGGEGPGGDGVEKPGSVPSAKEKAGADWAKKNHVKFYHGARHSEQLKVGDLIEPGHESQMGMSSNDKVYFTADPQTAEQYARGTPKAGTKPGMTPYVYEVRPVGDFHQDPGSPGYRSPSALRIVARVPVPKTKLGFGAGQGYTLPAGNHADYRVEGKMGGSKHPLFAGKDPEYEADAQHFEDMWYGGDDY